jgi:hypothetical protein
VLGRPEVLANVVGAHPEGVTDLVP